MHGATEIVGRARGVSGLDDVLASEIIWSLRDLTMDAFADGMRFVAGSLAAVEVGNCLQVNVANSERKRFMDAEKSSEKEQSGMVQKRMYYRRVLPIAFMHVGALFAPWCFSTSGLVVFFIMFALTGLGVTVGLHRLLTHQSFRTYTFVRRFLATLGAMAFQGGVIEWIALHRMHHYYSDTDGDPHSPRRSFWRGHMLWLAEYDVRIADKSVRRKWVRDLCKDGFLVALDQAAIPIQVVLLVALYVGGEAFGTGLGVSWSVYGVFVRATLLQQVTWLVNSAGHKWGYANADTKDCSRNNWFVALLTFGEGWHNNHHTMPRSASFQRKWFEIDAGFWIVRILEALGLAWDVVVPVAAASTMSRPTDATS